MTHFAAFVFAILLFLAGTIVSSNPVAAVLLSGLAAVGLAFIMERALHATVGDAFTPVAGPAPLTIRTLSHLFLGVFEEHPDLRPGDVPVYLNHAGMEPITGIFLANYFDKKVVVLDTTPAKDVPHAD